jgi:hypothetical protein
MVSPADILGGFSNAGFAQLSNTAARPSFELAFSGLQNTLLERLNKRIVELNEQSKDKNNVSALMYMEAKKFETVKPHLDRYAFETARNLNNVEDSIALLNEMSVSNLEGDSVAFDQKLEALRANMENISQVNGAAVGMFVSDGLQTIVQEGVLINGYDSYAGEATPATAREEAIAALRTKLTNSAMTAATNYEAVTTLKDRVDERLNGVLLQIQAEKLAGQAEDAKVIQDMQTEYHDLLNALSLSFEVSQAKNEQLTKSLFLPPEFEKGSILNVIS